MLIYIVSAFSCLRVLKKTSVMLVERVLCLRVLKKIPARLCGDNYVQCPRVLKKAPISVERVLCLWVLKKIPVMLMESVLCLRVLKKIPVMLRDVILSTAKDLLPVNPKTMSPTSSLRGGLCPTWQSPRCVLSC